MESTDTNFIDGNFILTYIRAICEAQFWVTSLNMRAVSNFFGKDQQWKFSNRLFLFSTLTIIYIPLQLTHKIKRKPYSIIYI
jgi:hypothetical protein